MSEEGEKETELKVSKIKDGTVVDHVKSGYALDVVRILGVDPRKITSIITIAMNVPSKQLDKGRKDIIKIEGMELNAKQINAIAIIAPHATINWIRNYEVFQKREVSLPKVTEGIIRCQNPTCITRAVRDDDPSIPKEPVITRFITLNPESEEPTFECDYCHSILSRKDAIEALI